jgi:hypothetical protein
MNDRHDPLETPLFTTLVKKSIPDKAILDNRAVAHTFRVRVVSARDEGERPPAIRRITS